MDNRKISKVQSSNVRFGLRSCPGGGKREGGAVPPWAVGWLRVAGTGFPSRSQFSHLATSHRPLREYETAERRTSSSVKVCVVSCYNHTSRVETLSLRLFSLWTLWGMSIRKNGSMRDCSMLGRRESGLGLYFILYS